MNKFKKYCHENISVVNWGIDRCNVYSDSEDIFSVKKGMFSVEQLSEIVKLINIQREDSYGQGRLDMRNEFQAMLFLNEVDEDGDEIE